MKEQPRSHELRITGKGNIIEYNLVFDERFECPHCKKESVKITDIGHPSLINGSYVVESECENCGETFSAGY